jgi:hypothetical protein
MFAKRIELSRRFGQIGLVMTGIPRRPHELGKSLLFLGTLRHAGWQRSAHARRAVDEAGDPLPWLTYPAIAWLRSRKHRINSVLEFGAGGSTLWFARMGSRVVAIEHNRGWAEELEAMLSRDAVRLVHVPGDETGYLGGLDEIPGETFDLVLIDGIHRAASAKAALRFMSDAALLCLDDSQRCEYAPIIAELHALGYRSIGFVGFAPIVEEEKETRFFSRRLDQWMDGAS